jgi:hypothetical protein
VRQKLAIAGAVLTVVTLAGLVSVGPAGAAGGGSGVTFKNDVFFSPSREPNPGWLTYCTPGCSQRVQVEDIDRSGGFKPPAWVFSGQSVDLGTVELFQVTDSYENRGSSFSYFFFVSAPNRSTPVTLTLTELHRGTYASEFRVSVQCRSWSGSTGSLPSTC